MDFWIIIIDYAIITGMDEEKVFSIFKNEAKTWKAQLTKHITVLELELAGCYNMGNMGNILLGEDEELQTHCGLNESVVLILVNSNFLIADSFYTTL